LRPSRRSSGATGRTVVNIAPPARWCRAEQIVVTAGIWREAPQTTPHAPVVQAETKTGGRHRIWQQRLAQGDTARQRAQRDEV
jgi:hypothetical protein